MSPSNGPSAGRRARIERATKESKVLVELEIDGTGRADVSTGVGFYDHMLSSLARHALLDLTVSTAGDTHIDAHHTVEDTAIVLGEALREALGDKAGIRRFGDSLVPLDEAYGEFRRAGTPSALELLPSTPNLVVTRTMSKAFALAGARVGYVAAAPEICDALRVVRLPYHLSATTQAVARVALRHADELLARVDDLRAERDATVDWLRGSGLQVADSDANFCLFGTFRYRHAVWLGLLDRGVLIRETGPDGWLRVSVGTPEEMAAFKAALTEVLK